jgi:hypothetical protein
MANTVFLEIRHQNKITLGSALGGSKEERIFKK